MFGANEEIYQVKKPDSNSAREIRDQILREYFGYTAEDVEALTAARPKLFFIEDTTKPGVWATSNQVKGWKTDAEGFLSIPIKKETVSQIIAFREQRLSVQINFAVAFIADPELRMALAENLRKIFGFSESERLAALSELVNSTTGTHGQPV